MKLIVEVTHSDGSAATLTLAAGTGLNLNPGDSLKVASIDGLTGIEVRGADLVLIFGTEGEVTLSGLPPDIVAAMADNLGQFQTGALEADSVLFALGRILGWSFDGVGDQSVSAFSRDIRTGIESGDGAGTEDDSATGVINQLSTTSIDPPEDTEGDTGSPDLVSIDLFADLVAASDTNPLNTPGFAANSIVVSVATGSAYLDTSLITLDQTTGIITYDRAAFDSLAAGERAIYTISFDVASGPNTQTQTVTLTIDGVNDAPVLTGDLNATVDEGATYVLTAADLGYADVDDGATAQTFAVSNFVNGAILVNGVAATQFTAAELGAGLVVFVHDDSQTLSASFDVSVEDGNQDGSTPVTQTFALSVNPVNDAPVANLPGIQTMLEDGTLVFSAGNGNLLSIADIDAASGTVSATLGVSSGSLTVTTGAAALTGNGSSAVTLTGTVAEINAALASVTYAPGANFNGSATLTLGVDDGGNSGLGGALSDSQFLTIAITPVNDAPSFALAGNQTIAEDAGPQTVANFISSISSGPADEAGQSVAFTVTTDNDALFSILPSIDASGTLTYQFADNVNGTATIAVTASDSGGTANGGVDTSAQQSFALTATAVNDAPVIAGLANASVAENLAGALIDTFTVADVDTSNGLSFRILNGGVPDSRFEVVKANGLGFGEPGTYELRLASGQSFDFEAENLDTNPTIDLTVEINDGAGANNITTAPITVTVTNVNEAPTAADQVFTLYEGQPFTVDFGAGSSDPEGDALVLSGVTPGAIAEFYSITSSSPDGLVRSGTVPANFNGTGSGRYQVRDTGGNYSNQPSVTIDIVAVNDAPEGGNASLSLNEDGSRVLTAADFGFSDPDDIVANASPIWPQFTGGSTGDALMSVKMASLPANGALLLNNVAITPAQVAGGFEVFVADIAAGNLRFVPNADFHGATNFTFQVRDDGGTANGGVDLDQSANTLTFNIASVNDAPAGTDSSVNTIENTPLILSAANFPFTDSDSPANGLASVRIGSLPAQGSLQFDGVAITQLQIDNGYEVSAADLALGKLTFVPGPGTAIGYASFTFQVRDDGGTANGGVDLDSVANTVTINVNPPGPTVDLDDNDSTASGRNFNTTYVEQGASVAIADTDSTITHTGATLTRATVTLTDAQLGDALSLSGGLLGGITATITPSAGKITIELTGTASLADYDDAIAKVRFSAGGGGDTPNPTDRSIEVALFDGAATGGVSTATIAVQPVNDAPNLTPNAPGVAAYTENATATALLAGGDIADPDNPFNFAGGSFTVAITANAAAGDQIVLLGASNFSSGASGTGASALYYNGHTIGTISGLGTAIVSVSGLTAYATQPVVDALSQAFGYQSSSENPATTARTVTFSFNDGANTGSGGAAQDVVTQVVNVTAVVDNPVTPPANPNALAAGDVAVIGYNTGQSDGSGQPATADSLSLVALKTITSGTQIFITDRSWNGTSFGAAGGGEGTYTYTAGADVPAGTVITLSQAQLSAAGITLEETGDNLYVYQGTDANTPTTFLYAVDYADGNTTFSASLANTGLAVGSSAIALDLDSAAYAGPTTQPQSLLVNGTDLAHSISDLNNWVGDNRDSVNAFVQPVQTNFLVAPDIEIAGATSGGSGDGIVTIGADTTTGGLAAAINQVRVYNSDGDESVAFQNLTVAPRDLVIDTVHGKFFLADSDLAGTNRILQGNLSDLLGNPGTIPTVTVLYADSTSGVNSQIRNLAIDPDNGQVFFSHGGTSSVQRINYDTAGQTPVTVVNLGAGNPNGNTNNFVDDFVINFATGHIYITSHRVTAAQDGDGVSRNFIYDASGLLPSSSSALSYSVLPFSPDDAASGALFVPGEAFPRELGSLEGIALSADGNTIYFATASLLEDTDGDGGTVGDGNPLTTDPVLRPGGIFSYSLVGNPTGTYTTIFTQTPGGAGPQGLLDELEIDTVSGRWYVSDTTGGTSAAGDEAIWTGLLSGGGATKFATVANINGGAVDGYQLDWAPTLTATALNPSTTESAGIGSGETSAATLFGSVTLGDVDTAGDVDELSGAVVRITSGLVSGADFLRINGATSGTIAGSGIAFTYNNSTGAMVLTGAATFAEYKAALELVTFSTNGGDNPTNYGTSTARTVAVSVSDGLLMSDEVTTNVTVVAVNDVPVVDLDGNDSGGQGAGNFAATYVLSAAAVAVVDADIVITDPDSALMQSATVVLTNAQPGDLVTFAGPLPLGIAATVTPGAGTITVSFAGAATTDAYELALHALRYANSDGAPSLLARTFTITVSDGTGDSLSRTATIAMLPDGVPTATNDTGTATEAGSAAGTDATGSVRTNDTDPQDASAALVVIAVRTGAEAVLGIAGTVGNALVGLYGALTLNWDGSYTYQVDNTNPTVNGLGTGGSITDVFTYIIRDTGGAIDAAQLTVTINGASDLPVVVADTGTMSEDAAATLFDVKANDTLDPDAGAANTIAVGSVTATGPGSTGIDSASVTATVISGQIEVMLGSDFQRLALGETATITVPYTLTGNAGENSTANLTVTVNGANDPVLAVADAGTMTEDGAGLFVVRGNDTLDLDHTATNAITVGAVSINAAPGGAGIDAGDVTVGVDGSNRITIALGSDFQKLGAGETATFTVDYTLQGDQPSDTSSSTLQVTVNGVNDAPVVDLLAAGGVQNSGTTATFVENGAVVSIVPQLSLADIDNANFSGATVTLTNMVGGEDVLTVNGGVSGAIGGVNYSVSGNVVTFSGAASVAAYEAAIEAVQYANTSENPNATGRSFTIAVSDGTDTGTANATVNVTAVNDAPVNAGVPATQQTAFSDTSLAVTGLSISDIDAGGGIVTTTLSASHGGIFVGGGGGALVSGNGSHSVAITGTVAQVNAALSGSVSYVSDSGYTGQETVSVVTNDGGNTPAPAQQDSDSFNIAVLPQVWFIDNTPPVSPSGPLGSQNNPFTSIADFNTAQGQPGGPGANDTIYLRAGTYSEADGINLASGQTLIGQGENLEFPNPFGGGTIVLEAGSAGLTPVIVVTGANEGIELAQNNTIRGLDIGMNNAGAVGIEDGGGTVGTLTISNVGVGVNSSLGSAIDIDQGGTLNVILDSVTSSGAARGIDLGTTTGLAGTGNGFTVSGTTVINDATGDGIVIGKSSLNASFTGKVTILNDAGGANGDGIDLGTTGGGGANTGAYSFNGGVDVTVNGVDAYGLRATSSGTVNILNPNGNNQITSNNGTAILVNPTTLNANLTSVTSTGDSGTNGGISLTGMSGTLTIGSVDIDGQDGSGISIDSSTGSVTINGGAIGSGNDPGGHGVDVYRGTGDVSIGASVQKSSGSAVVQVFDHDSGTVTFSGNITTTGGNNSAIYVASNNGGTVNFTGQSISLSNGANNGVTLLNNSGATINFNTTGGNGLDISTTSGIGFTATGGGTVNVTGTGNTITSTTGTALNVVDTTIGANGLTFQSISANGAVNGIVLNNTGSLGGLTVTGTDGADAGTLADTGTGGTVQNTSGDSISLNSTRAVSLGGMNISQSGANNAGNDNSNWIDATDVVGLSLLNVNATDSVGHGFLGNSVTNLVIQGGLYQGGGTDNDIANFNGFNITNLLGTSSITGTTFERANTVQFRVNNNTATNFNGTPDTLTVSNTTWQNQNVSPFHGDHLSVSSDTGGNFRINVDSAVGQNVFRTGGIAVQAAAGGTNGKMDANISGISSGGSLASGLNNTAMAVIAQTGGGSITYDIVNNTSLGTGSVAIKVTHASTLGGTSSGTISGNNITHIAGSGTDAIGIDLQPNGTATTQISNNTITGNYQRGILVQALGGTGVINATITNNTLTGTATDGLQHIAVINGGSGGGHLNTMRLNMFSNTVNAGGGYTAAYRLVSNDVGSSFQLQDLVGAGNQANVQNWISATKANVGTGLTVDATVPYTASAGAIPTPAVTPLLAAQGEGPGSAAAINADMLAPILAAALQHWADAGLAAGQLALLDGLSFAIADLDGAMLGSTSGGVVTIDADAAGWGWFVDPTPQDNAEFAASDIPHQLVATGGEAAGGMDLLTVVAHEIGHVLGFEHADSGVMAETLAVGTRETLDVSEIVPAATVGTNGDDTFLVDEGSHGAIIGGAGTDTLALTGGGIVLDFTQIAEDAVQSVERIDLTGTGDNALTLNLADLLDMSSDVADGVTTLTVTGNTGDSVTLADSGWTEGAAVNDNGIDYAVWTNEIGRLLVETDIAVAHA